MDTLSSPKVRSYVAGALRRAKAVAAHQYYTHAHRSGPHFTVRVERDKLDGGYIAEVTQVPGCVSQGETQEEAVDNVIEALREILAAQFAQEIQTHPRPVRKRAQTYDLAVGAC